MLVLSLIIESLFCCLYRCCLMSAFLSFFLDWSFYPVYWIKGLTLHRVEPTFQSPMDRCTKAPPQSIWAAWPYLVNNGGCEVLYFFFPYPGTGQPIVFTVIQGKRG